MVKRTKNALFYVYVFGTREERFLLTNKNVFIFVTLENCDGFLMSDGFTGQQAGL